MGKAVLVLTGNMESAITVADHVYRLDETGLHAIDTDEAQQDEEFPVAQCL